MVVIRLARGGVKNAPYYSVVVTKSTSPRDGRFIEKVGFYNPSVRGQAIELSLELSRIEHWVSVGAQLSDTVASLVKRFRKQAVVATQA